MAGRILWDMEPTTSRQREAAKPQSPTTLLAALAASAWPSGSAWRYVEVPQDDRDVLPGVRDGEAAPGLGWRYG